MRFILALMLALSLALVLIYGQIEPLHVEKSQDIVFRAYQVLITIALIMLVFNFIAR
jgi:hypothetical protein